MGCVRNAVPWRVRVTDMQAEMLDSATLRLDTLPAGSYATVLLEQLGSFEESPTRKEEAVLQQPPGLYRSRQAGYLSLAAGSSVASALVSVISSLPPHLPFPHFLVQRLAFVSIQRAIVVGIGLIEQLFMIAYTILGDLLSSLLSSAGHSMSALAYRNTFTRFFTLPPQ